MKNINTIMRSIGLSLVLGSFPLMDVMGESVTISHLVNEQNIVLIKDSESKYLLLPVQENAPEGKVNIVVNNEFQLEQKWWKDLSTMKMRLLQEFFHCMKTVRR